eukprot:4591670-Pleurochrysis_carterae.AAC.2
MLRVLQDQGVDGLAEARATHAPTCNPACKPPLLPLPSRLRPRGALRLLATRTCFCAARITLTRPHARAEARKQRDTSTTGPCSLAF